MWLLLQINNFKGFKLFYTVDLLCKVSVTVLSTTPASFVATHM